MAASLSRPDPSSPASVAEASFSTTRRGFHPDEVRAFLTAVAAEMSRLSERERQLEAELREARAVSAPAELDEETVANLVGEETLRVLQTARESASEIKIRAEETAGRVLHEATDEVNRLRQEAEVEAARRRQDAQSDAESEVAIAKQQGREMVNEARAYRERVLADLERRTTLARHQIEELMHGRDRLLQVFERARLVAVDVTSGLREVDAPDELVNLSPTTGPVPIMVPNQPRPEPAADMAEAPADTAAPASDESAPEPTSDDAELTEKVVDATTDATTDAIDEAVETPETPETPEADDIDVAETDEAVEVDDAGDDTATDEDATEPNGRPSDNVVSLFGGRVPAQEAAEADEHPSVDDIFERLRHEADTDETAPDEAAPDEADAAEVTADETETTDTVADADTADAEVDEIVEPTVFGRRDEALVPLIVAGARRLKRVLADEQNEVLDALRQGEPVESLDAIVPLVDEHRATYTAALADELAQAVGAGALEGGARNNKTTRTKLVKAGALDRANDQVLAALVGPLRGRLERAINDGAGDNDDITKRVRAVYREWKTQHIDAELDDVFRHAFSDGMAVAVEPGTPLVWTIDPSAVACPDCEDNSLAGNVPAGDAFPTGHPAAPAHPGCRCLALPVE